MSNLEFAVGKRVVCISDRCRGLLGELAPTKGCIYTIREIGLPFGLVGLRLVEIINEPREYLAGRHECWFLSWHFRPVRETSIDCFTALLEKPPVKQTEDA